MAQIKNHTLEFVYKYLYRITMGKLGCTQIPNLCCCISEVEKDECHRVFAEKEYHRVFAEKECH